MISANLVKNLLDPGYPEQRQRLGDLKMKLQEIGFAPLGRGRSWCDSVVDSEMEYELEGPL